MKKPSAAALKKVTAENLAHLGVERLAGLLVDVAETRPELKRRLRMELAAAQGADHLVAEIDRRLRTLETSRGKISWRQRPAFARDLDGLEDLIGVRLAALSPGMALTRLWAFLDLWPRLSARVRDQDGVVAAPFQRAATHLGRLLSDEPIEDAAAALTAALCSAPGAWAAWLPELLDNLGAPAVSRLLTLMRQVSPQPAGWPRLIRLAADRAGDPVAYRETYGADDLRDPRIAAAIATRDLAAGRVGQAGELLRGAAPTADRRGRTAPPDEAWESAWIAWLEAADDAAAAQALRWESFKRTLAPSRAKDIVARLRDFEDVEAEEQIFDIAASHRNSAAALNLLMTWPSLTTAAALIERRVDELQVDPADAERWAAKLRRRFPKAAHRLLRRGAALAFRQHQYKLCERLTEEAEAISLPPDAG